MRRAMAGPSKTLETFPNPSPDRDYEIAFDVPEFTCLCPLTGQPDFARFTIRYVPDQKCVELKSLKLYFWSYRNEDPSSIFRSVSRMRCSVSRSKRLVASRVWSSTALGWDLPSGFTCAIPATLFSAQ